MERLCENPESNVLGLPFGSPPAHDVSSEIGSNQPVACNGGSNIMTFEDAGMTEFRFTKDQHLRSKQDFERVYALKNKAADGILLLFVARNGSCVTRIGLSVSKKHGGAVVRNRLKRLLREAFRLRQQQIPSGVDLIAIPLSKEKATRAVYEESLVKLSRRLTARLDRAVNTNEASP